jgi:hypothetical protein
MTYSSHSEWGIASNGAEDDAAAEVDGRYHGTDEPHRTFGYQIHGPSALGVEESLPDIPFFQLAQSDES